MALGVEVLLNTKVTGVEHKYRYSKTTSGVTLQQTSVERSIPCRNLVIAAGPWSQRVLASLFPSAQIKIPMDTVSSAGNHLTVKTPGWNPSDDNNPCQQLILDDVLGRPLDISSLLGGTLYIGSYGAEPEELPDLATQVQPQPKAIEGIRNLCRRALNIPVDDTLEIVKAGRCYRPIVKQGHPIIAEVPLSLLQKESGSLSTLRVFFNTGHGSYGITQGPGSGKLMSELVMGEKLSVDISGLGYEE